jgi:hypothetical protein
MGLWNLLERSICTGARARERQLLVVGTCSECLFGVPFPFGTLGLPGHACKAPKLPQLHL